jgi:hypothetical protein
MTVGKTRSPIGVVLLSIVTLGIYYLYWYYAINSEMRRYRPFIEVSPGIALLSQFVPIANWISAYNTAGRLLMLQDADRVADRISPGIALVLHVLLYITYPFYVQDHLNRLWEAASHGGALGSGPSDVLRDGSQPAPPHNDYSPDRPADQSSQ